MNGPNGGGILLARGGGQLLTCLVCKRPTPLDHLAMTSPREGVCAECWARAGNLRNWFRQPALSNGLPVLDVLHLMLSPYVGQRGDDRNGIRTLARLLEERERLRVTSASAGERVVAARCCYCHEPEHEDQDNLKFVMRDADQGAPDIFHCRDFEACDGRVFQRIMLMAASVIHGQQVPQ